ncbi:MAG: hypothetical protein MUD08_12135 [Cytophagales bacterium]|jgi:hypothetical protein|nr:hypothetical protein [Cytophagales bacterium]
MQGCRFPILFVTAFLVVYTLSPHLGASPLMISSAYLASPFLVIWMVVRVLKKGEPSGRTFDEGYFYDDENAPQSIEREMRKAA